tara:strand:+ start:81 stop:1385 length:1305 start_codon:yes stop_codon:yes gene_type:complete
MTKLEFVNHSCIILSNNDVSLSIDPWIDGSVFNNSWNLLVKTPLKSIENLKKSKYVWFSHEHPDHFNPPNLKIFSNNNNFLFQQTKDKRVIKFLSKISSNVKEIKFKDKFFLDKCFSIQVLPFQYLDSMCLIEIDGIKILNLNDCDIKNDNQLKIIKNFCEKIDVLMVQFSYAIGKSNKESIAQRRNWSLTILKKLSKNINYLKPKYVIPFASFCYFSRHDNFYLNDSINKIGPTIDFLKKNNPNVKFLCFYPGDMWDLKTNWCNDDAIYKYSIDYDNIKPLNFDYNKFDFDKIKNVADKFIKNTMINNNLFYFYNFFKKKNYKIYFNVTDINKKFKFDFSKGLIIVNNILNSQPSCSLTSESLYQLFNSGYGYDALIIGGRFEANDIGMFNLNKIFKFQAKNYQNIYYNFSNIFSNLLNKFFKNNIIFYDRGN